MFRYYLKLAVVSVRANPVLSSLMVAAIATGIGACVTILNIEHVMGSNPIPHRSDLLYYVQLDSWDPYNAAVEPDLPPRQVTLRDGTAIMENISTRARVGSGPLVTIAGFIIEGTEPKKILLRGRGPTVNSRDR